MFATYVRRKEIAEGLARELYDLHLEAPLDVIDPPRDRLLECALEYEATVYDAIYIQLSILHQAPLITAERTTTPWVVKLKKLAVSLGR